MSKSSYRRRQERRALDSEVRRRRREREWERAERERQERERRQREYRDFWKTAQRGGGRVRRFRR